MKDDWRNITPSGEHDVSVLFVNVGKADSIIVDIDGSYYMIDTGTSESVPYTFAALEALGVDKLSGVFMSEATATSATNTRLSAYILRRYAGICT